MPCAGPCAGPCADIWAPSQHWLLNHNFQPKLIPKSCFSAKIEPGIMFFSQNWSRNHVFQPKFTPKSCFSAKIDPRIVFFSQNWPRNHVLQPKLTPESCFSAKICAQSHIFQAESTIHACIMCKYVCNKQTYYQGIKCLMSLRLILHTTHKGKNNSTDGGGGEAAAPIGTVVARAQRAPPLCVVCRISLRLIKHFIPW